VLGGAALSGVVVALVFGGVTVLVDRRDAAELFARVGRWKGGGG
jgi:hypothetical protein